MTNLVRVGIISQWYAPEPVLIPKTVADSVVADGNSVNVLTGFPNYPGGSIYTGYEGNHTQDERLDGALLRRVRSFVSHDQNAVRRIRSFLSFAWNSSKNFRFLSDCDVVYVYGTPMTTVVPALALRLRKNIPFIVHVQDLWPESVLDSGMVGSSVIKRFLHLAISALLKPTYRLAHHIIVISPGMKTALIERGVDEAKISILLNWHAGQESVTTTRSGIASPSRVRFVYAGNIGLMQDVETIIRAAAEVLHELDLEILIYGSGVAEDDARELAVSLAATNIRFMGRISMAEMPAVYATSDFQLVTLKDRQVFRVTIPSKFQASMANGVPVITTVKGDLADICVKERVGLIADPEDPLSLADAFRAAVRLGPSGRAEMATRAQHFYWKQLAADIALASIMDRLSRAAQQNVKLNSSGVQDEGKPDETN